MTRSARSTERPLAVSVRARGGVGVAGERISAEAADAFLAGHTLSIREVESLTGLDLLPQLDTEALKRAVASELWPRN